MEQRPQTIQIYLPGGNPRGVRIAEITTRIVQVIEVPRLLLPTFLKSPQAKQVAVYFLVAEGTEDADPQVYVGQSSDLPMRFPQHNREKDFWERALVLVSRTHSLTQTHALFLEWYCLQEAKRAGRFATTNANNASRPHTPAPLEADCFEIFDTARTLLSTLGFPLFEPVISEAQTEAKSEMLFCKSSGADGRGYFTSEGLVVLKGSTGRRESVQSIKGTADERFRDRLIANGIMVEQGDRVAFTRDHVFKSPSTAAVALVGRTANGWIEWKNGSGQTLHDLKRAPDAEEQD